MNIKIEYGKTIITTSRATSELQNKNGYRGVNYMSNQNKYRAEIQINNRKYVVGSFSDLNDAVKARKVAEMYRDSGELMEFLKTKPHGHATNYTTFWSEQFKKLNRSD